MNDRVDQWQFFNQYTLLQGQMPFLLCRMTLTLEPSGSKHGVCQYNMYIYNAQINEETEGMFPDVICAIV